VVDFEKVSLAFGERKIIDDFNFEFTASHKVGIIGANGAGKTTLLKLLTGSLTPDSGNIKIAETVRFNYIDQRRVELDEEKTVYDEVAGGVDVIPLGTEHISVRAYLKRFLFEDERINGKVRYLSGGEKARLLLAKVLKRGGNFLILDEPTNDLDLPTLRVLEEALAEFNSTLIVVSHDRYFLNRVCNHIIAFEEISPGVTVPLSTPGDYDYFLSVRNRLIDAHKSKLPQKNGKVETVPEAKKSAPPKTPAKKLSYREQQELLHMEENIAAAEEKLAAIESRFSEPDFFVRNAKNMPEFEAELAAAKAEVERLYARWDELEQLKNSL
jgi:ATP-binding cassette subfamily F protein uup